MIISLQKKNYIMIDLGYFIFCGCMFTLVSAQRGIFYAEDRPARTLSFRPVSRFANPDTRENVLVTLRQPIKFFRDQNVRQIRVSSALDVCKIDSILVEKC